MLDKISVGNGKYEIIVGVDDDKKYVCKAKRYGETWIPDLPDTPGANMILQMAYELQALRGESEALKQRLYDSIAIQKSISSCLKIIDNCISEAIKAENGEESSIAKFKNMESFANWISLMVKNQIDYLDEKIGKNSI